MRGSMLARAAGCTLAVFSFSGLAFGADIADLAPRSSFFVASVEDWPAIKSDFEKNGLVDLWKDQSVKDYAKVLFEGMFGRFQGFQSLEGQLKELGIKLDDLPELGKTTGFASFAGPKQGADGKPIEGDDAESITHVLIVTSLDGGEGKDGRGMWEIVEEALDTADQHGDLELEPVDYGDAELYRVITTHETEHWDDDAWEKWDPNAPDADQNMPEPTMVEVKDVEYVAHAADHLVYSTSFDVIRDAIDRLEGRDRGETVGDVASFVEGRNAKPAGAHAYIVALPATMVESGMGLDSLPFPLPGGDETMARAMFDALGLTEVTALSGALVTNGPDSLAEVHLAALMHEQRGVFSLITGDALPATPPSFVGPEASGLGVFRVNFAGIIPLVRASLASLPDSPETQGMQAQVEQFAAVAEPLFNALGPEVVQVGTVTRPFSPESQGMLVAIATKDANAVRQAINTFGGMVGLTPRDFAGSQIWESQFAPVSIGLTDTQVFVGLSGAGVVEKAMLTGSQPDAPKLADDPRFAPARRALGQGGLAMGWQNLKTALEFTAWHAENFERVTRAQLEKMGMPQEQVDEYMQFMMEQAPAAATTPPPADALTRVLGDVASVFRSTNRGIEGRVVFLKAAR